MQSIHVERHRTEMGGWLRAAVLGANDGTVSTASLVLGVAAADAPTAAIVLAGLAGLIGGALSMAAGEYVSVSSQRDIERADLAMEASELKLHPERELKELEAILASRGMPPEVARQAAKALTENDALAAHAREELGIDVDALARPGQAAAVSALSFAVGAAIPLSVIWAAPLSSRGGLTLLAALVTLAGLGAWSARLGGAPVLRAVLRVLVGGALAMGLTAALGHFLGPGLA